MNLWLAYNIVLVLGLVIALAWAYDARRYAQRAFRLRDCDLPTEEIPLPATMKIGPRLEEFGPGKPVPHMIEPDPEVYRDGGLMGKPVPTIPDPGKTSSW